MYVFQNFSYLSCKSFGFLFKAFLEQNFRR